MKTPAAAVKSSSAAVRSSSPLGKTGQTDQ
jgi:hypothetical protein